MKTLIIYKTIFGASKKYADWIQEDIGGKMKKIICIILLLIISLGVRGYMEKEKYKDEMLSYLETKYSEKFEVIRYQDNDDNTSSTYGGGDYMFVYPLRDKKLIAQVKRINEEDNYTDTYDRVKDSELITNLLGNKIYKLDANILDVRMTINDVSKDMIDYNMTIEEAVKRKDYKADAGLLEILIIADAKLNNDQRFELLKKIRTTSSNSTLRYIRLFTTFANESQREMAIKSNILGITDDANYPAFENDGVCWYNSLTGTTDEEIIAQITKRGE